MAVWTEEIATEYSFPNLTLYKRLRDGEQTGWKLTANEGYVFYDRTESRTEQDPITGEEVPVTYYFRLAYLPLNANFDNFPYVAIPESEADENFIFGGGDNNNHEVM